MRYIAKNLSSISDLVKELKNDLGDYEGPVWYRGQANKNWRLLPRLCRLQNEVDEMNLIRQFRQSATMLLDPRPQETQEWLFIMQHHGVPTRLLDWTESALMAAYFAVDQEPDSDGALWVLLPMELNEQAGIYELPAFEETNVLINYLPEYIEQSTTVKYGPIAISATRNNPRMESQLSVFTTNHKLKTPIERVGNRQHVWRYLIPKDEKDSVLKELALLGIRRFQLFPELQTLGEIIGENC